MPDPRDPVVCCTTCARELTRAERHAAHETAGRCDDCDAHAVAVASLARAVTRGMRLMLAFRRDVAEQARREAAGEWEPVLVLEAVAS